MNSRSQAISLAVLIGLIGCRTPPSSRQQVLNEAGEVCRYSFEVDAGTCVMVELRWHQLGGVTELASVKRQERTTGEDVSACGMPQKCGAPEPQAQCRESLRSFSLERGDAGACLIGVAVEAWGGCRVRFNCARVGGIAEGLVVIPSEHAALVSGERFRCECE